MCLPCGSKEFPAAWQALKLASLHQSWNKPNEATNVLHQARYRAESSSGSPAHRRSGSATAAAVTPGSAAMGRGAVSRQQKGWSRSLTTPLQLCLNSSAPRLLYPEEPDLVRQTPPTTARAAAGPCPKAPGDPSSPCRLPRGSG